MYLNPEQIQHAVNDAEWQEFRLSLKGLKTAEKLSRLKVYLPIGIPDSDIRCVRVQNYLNALARGGLIRPTDKNSMVRHQVMDAEILRRQNVQCMGTSGSTRTPRARYPNLWVSKLGTQRFTGKGSARTASFPW